MIRSLILASTVTILAGTACTEAWFRVSFVGRDVLWLIGVVVSIAAGPVILWRRGTQPIVPIAAIYCVVMFFVLLLIDFNLAWGKGLVDL